MSVEELYDQVVEEKVVDEMYADQSEVDIEKEFIKKAEPKWELTPIPLEEIDRKHVWKDVEIYQGHPMPVLISAGSLPMISLRDGNFNPQKNIVMTCCMEYYDETLQKIYEWLAHYNDKEPQIQPTEQVEEETEEYEVPRAVMGLAKLVDDARENLFLNIGADQISNAIVQHINSLVKLGHYPQKMFGNYLKDSARVKQEFGANKIIPLLDLILCAEVVMPSQEELIPKKRIDTALPSAGSR
jgi:hypothetical protein